MSRSFLNLDESTVIFFRFDRETHRIDNTYFASEKYTQIILLAIPIESVKFKNSYLCVVHGIHEVGRCCIFINFMKCEIALCIIFRCTYLFSRSSTQTCLVTLSLALCVCLYVTMMNQMLTVISMSYEDVQSGIYFKKQIIIRKLCLAVEE